MRRFMQQEGFWRTLLREHFGCNVDEVPGADPYELYALMASQRCLRRSRWLVCPFELPNGPPLGRRRRAASADRTALRTTVENMVEPMHEEDPDAPPIWIRDYDGDVQELERHVFKQVDQIVERSGAKVGDVIDFEQSRCLGWNIVGRTIPGTSRDKFYLRWNDSEVANVSFLITKHVRNAMWMYYDILMYEDLHEVHLWLARDDDFVVALLGQPLPEGIGMVIYPDPELRTIESVTLHNEKKPFLTSDFETTRAFLQVKRTEIPAAEAADYRSLASCARANCLAVTGQATGFRYELDMDDEETAHAVQRLRDGTSPILEHARDRTPIDPAVVLRARHLPEPANDDEWKAEDARVEQFYEWFPYHTSSSYDEYNRALRLVTTTSEVHAAVERIRGLWDSPDVEFMVSQPFSRRFPTGIHRRGQPAPVVLEDICLIQAPTSVGIYPDRARPLREVTFDWKDYWQ
jgi:hypothetical protein